MLSIQLEKGGRSERDKLGRRFLLGSGLVVQVVSALLRGSWQDIN